MSIPSGRKRVRREFVAMEPQVPLMRQTNSPVFEPVRTIPLKLVKNETTEEADDEESTPSGNEELPTSEPEEPIAVQQDRFSAPQCQRHSPGPPLSSLPTTR